ncbi:hypothetical protein AVEN_171624-1 [Araneus ventricosus]|uniref:Uncharacterized protein n=1 Tax=Araneus ventricosus TaxID=182803 RepID=A0A4Y2F3B7_ARAVE|nr:hypothetical protein AVEN_171624-1 [Araneus ventricosus]
MVSGTTGTPTSDCIVERLTMGSTSACRTILRSSRLVFFLVAPDPVRRTWVPSRVHCSQHVLTAIHLNDRPGEQHGASTSLQFHANDDAPLKLLNCEKCLPHITPITLRPPRVRM